MFRIVTERFRISSDSSATEHHPVSGNPTNRSEYSNQWKFFFTVFQVLEGKACCQSQRRHETNHVGEKAENHRVHELRNVAVWRTSGGKRRCVPKQSRSDNVQDRQHSLCVYKTVGNKAK